MDHVPEYRGTRLAVGELPRATTQTAITVALAMGHPDPHKKEPKFREYAASSTAQGGLKNLKIDER